jgi:hypothetical protein
MKTRTLIVSSTAMFLAASSLLADVREGLVAYWPLDIATNGTAMITPDVVAGNNLFGPTKDSATALVAGKYGNAVTFAGNTSDYLVFTNAAGADTGLPVARLGSWTYSLWVNGASNQTDQTTFFAEASGYNANWRFAMECNGTDKTRYLIRDGNVVVKNSTVGTVPTLDSTWHHIAYTYDITTSQFRVYVDGQLNDGPDTFTYAQASTSFNSVGIGALVRTTVGVPFTGAVDDVALWGRALTQAEIDDVRTNSITLPIPAFAPVITVNPSSATNLYPGDSFTMSSLCIGTRPFFYQWQKDGTNVPGANAITLALSSVTTNDSGQYRLVITNAAGSATSTVAQITVNSYASPNLTNGMVAYWPLDGITGVKTPDLVSAYDLTLAGTVNPTLTAGKWGSAMSFNAANSQYARRIHNSGETLPIYRRTNFTVSVWVKATPPAAFNWFFSEASTVNNNSAFAIGFNTGSDKLNTFVRTDGGSAVINNVNSTTVIGDDVWHNVVWVQRDVGGTPKAQVYIDGALSLNLTAAYGVTPNNTSLGCFGRATPNGFFTGLLDEVGIWERPLSPDEITLLQTSYITNPPVRILPLAVNAFKADLPSVAQGDSTVLRWDVPASVNSVSIDPIGTVTGQTVSGVGSTNVSPTSTTAYVLTATRTTGIYGTEIVKATNVVGVVSGVVANWSLLDNFDFYNPGLLAANGWWIDVGGGSSVGVVTNGSCNRLAKTLTSSSAAYLKLNALTVNSNQSRTLFFRMIPTVTDANQTRNYVGITDRPGNLAYQYTGGNIGPAVYPTVNDPSQTPGDWLLGAFNVPYTPITYATNVLETNAIYNVWIDVTNVFIGDRVYPDNYDTYSVYIQKEGDAGRAALFTDFVSDRDLTLSDVLTGGLPTDPLTRVYLAGSRTDYSALFDDFYLSKSGYNATIPRAAGYAGPPPTLQIVNSGGQWQIVFQGKLLEATTADGTYTEVTGATSPYVITASGDQKFYRAVCN